MFVKFNHPWGKYLPGDVANIELTLSRRLVGTGIVEYRADKGIKTTPEFANDEPEPEKQPEPKKEPEPKEEPEEEVEEPVKAKKKVPKRKYTKPEKAVKIEK